MFELIKNDNEIIDAYSQVKKFEEIDKEWAHHGLEHVLSVVDLIEKILTELNYDENFINDAKIAALLHDTGCTEGKENHPERSYNFAKDYFKRKNIILKNEEMVLESIKNHSNGFDTDNIMTLALILADKLDIKSGRITEEGKKIKGNRQYQYIEDIILEMKNNILIVNFICNKKIDLDEMMDYYFTKKVFKAIDAFAKKIKYDSKILINGSELISEKM